MDADRVNELKMKAWQGAKAELAGIESKVRAKVTPKSTEEEIRTLYEDATVPYLIGHLMRSEAICALVTQTGIFDPQIIAVLMGSLRSFCQAAAQAQTAFCPNKPCEWRGQVADAGPVGSCPTCGKHPVKTLNLTVPATGGRPPLRLVGGES